MNEEQNIEVIYKNWRGEVANRKIIPISITFDSTEWHSEKQWLLECYDLDRKNTRLYALKDIQSWKG